MKVRFIRESWFVAYVPVFTTEAPIDKPAIAWKHPRFETALRNLCGQSGLEIGLVPLPQINGRYVYLPNSPQRSVFLRLTGTEWTIRQPQVELNDRRSGTRFAAPNFCGFGGAVFASVGAVAPAWDKLRLRDVESTGGAGLRYRLYPKKDMFLRLDVGFTQQGSGYYIATGKSF